MCRCGGSGWTAARIGSGGPGDSLRIWPLMRAFLLTCPRVAGPACDGAKTAPPLSGIFPGKTIGTYRLDGGDSQLR